jgi:hypothetical protein
VKTLNSGAKDGGEKTNVGIKKRSQELLLKEETILFKPLGFLSEGFAAATNLRSNRMHGK